jgi:cell division protease FtsH
MVCEWGMSDKLGPITFGKREEQIFLGKDIMKHKDYSEKTAEEIDGEVKTIITERYEYAKNLLINNKATLMRLAQALRDKETLDGVEIEAIIQGTNGDMQKEETEKEVKVVPETSS